MKCSDIKGFGIAIGAALLMAGGSVLVGQGLSAGALAWTPKAIAMISAGGAALAGVVGIGAGIICYEDPVKKEERTIVDGANKGCY